MDAVFSCPGCGTYFEPDEEALRATCPDCGGTVVARFGAC